MNDFMLDVTVYDLRIDSHLDRLIRSSDPYLQEQLEKEVRSRLVTGQQFPTFHVTESDLKRLANIYGEQYVQNPCTDLDLYFDLINRRFFSRPVPTQLAVLYLFGSGKQYRANISALSTAGEAVAGCCLEHFGLRPLVRPLGMMPDAVFWTTRNSATIIALAEAKASTTRRSKVLIDQNVFQFLVDVKTRATGFGYRYEAYLVCSYFQDSRKIECSILRVDLDYYYKGTDVVPGLMENYSAVPGYEDPDARLRGIIRVQAETVSVRDAYLTGMLSEEASRSATLAVLKEGRALENADEVDAYIRKTAEDLGLRDEWEQGQSLIKDTKQAEKNKIKGAIQKYRKPDIKLEE